MRSTLIVSLLSAASTVVGHGIVQQLRIGNTLYDGSLVYSDPYKNPVPDRIMQSFFPGGNGPIVDVSSPFIACNNGSKPAKLVAPAEAGSAVTFYWTEWPTGHLGPVITYLADCGGDCTQADGSKLDWFKIDEAGFKDGTWAATTLIAQNNTWTVNLPKKIKNGQYLLRHEIIALHSAGQANGAQFYPSCTNIEISGATGENLPETVKLPGSYSPTDPGILINIYYPKVTNYTIPGPKLYTEDGVTSGNAPSSSVSAFPTFVPTNTQGMFPTGAALVVGTGGLYSSTAAAIATDAPSPTTTQSATETGEPDCDDEDDSDNQDKSPDDEDDDCSDDDTTSSTTFVTTTFITTIGGGQEVTFTASYTSMETGAAATGASTPAPVVVPPSGPDSCVASTATVTETTTVTIMATYAPSAVASDDKYVTIRTSRIETAYETITIQPSSSAPVASAQAVADFATKPSSSSTSAVTVPAYAPHSSASVIAVPASAPPSEAVSTTIAVPTTTMPVSYISISSSPAPSGTGTPLTGFEGAKSRYDCEQAFDNCKKTYNGCLRRAKRTGMQTRSCEKYNQDICVTGLQQCDASLPDAGYGY